jgi:hypothetical protein
MKCVRSIYERVFARYKLHFRGRSFPPRTPVMAWIEATDESLLYLSVLTLGDIRKGPFFGKSFGN